MKNLLLLFVLASFSILGAQNLPTLKFIEGGTAILGGGYQYRVESYYMVLLGHDEDYEAMNKDKIVIGEVPSENNMERRVTVSSFFIAETEVTNAQYREFLMDSLLSAAEKSALLKKVKKEGGREPYNSLIEKAIAAALIPDTTCWSADFQFAYNEPLVINYHWHPAFDAYPVVGVSWDQANAYCEWLTRTTNRARTAKGKEMLPAYRLPTEMEWEFAAKDFGKREQTDSILIEHFQWNGNLLRNAKGGYIANFKTWHGDYIGDGYEYTSPVRTFSSNSNGLYQMQGNVAEWCMDVFRVHSGPTEDLNPRRNRVELFEAADMAVSAQEERVAKGGSWAEYCYALKTGSRMGWLQNKGSSRIGFRVAMTKMGSSSGHF